ncbi:MAG: hypothetical protein HRU40_16360 [Saprospiraceae bacterium]|nr:hypothetical protein [Saprospiraceae bacterium]
MSIKCTLCTLFAIGFVSCYAQEVTPTFSFNNGIYYSYEQFISNQPAIKWKNLETSLITNPRTWITQVEYIQDKKTKEPINIDALWGFTIDGIPYIRIPTDSIDKLLPAFAGLRITGSVCYFQYETTEARTLEMAAYNPLTGRPFRKGRVERNVVRVKEWLMRFSDGTIGPFTKAQMIEWTPRDRMIQLALRRLQDDSDNLEDQLYNLLLSYNKRHPAFINK